MVLSSERPRFEARPRQVSGAVRRYTKPSTVCRRRRRRRTDSNVCCDRGADPQPATAHGTKGRAQREGPDEKSSIF